MPEWVFHPLTYNEPIEYSQAEPVLDDIFMVYRNQFLYDSTDLHAVVEESDNGNKDWTIEKIAYNAAYGNERVIAYLFLPKDVRMKSPLSVQVSVKRA